MGRGAAGVAVWAWMVGLHTCPKKNHPAASLPSASDATHSSSLPGPAPAPPPQFVCNGLLWPDRSLHPAAYEVKQLQAPLAVSLPEAATSGGQQRPQGELRLRLRNKQHFSSTDRLQLRWRLLADGLPVAAGAAGSEGWRLLALPQPLGPQHEAEAGLGVTWAELAEQAQQAAEPCLEVQAQVGGRVWAGLDLARSTWSVRAGVRSPGGTMHCRPADSKQAVHSSPCCTFPAPAAGSRPAVGARWARGADGAAAAGRPAAAAAAAGAAAAAAGSAAGGSPG